MTFRAVVRDGMIAINTHGQLPDGTEVEVLPVNRPAPRRKGKKKAAKAASRTRGSSSRGRAGKSAKASADPLDSLIGIWKDRPDWKGKSTLEIAAELREKALGRTRRG